MHRTAEEIQELLAAPFPADEVQWVIMATTEGKEGGPPQGKVGGYIDPRTVRGRLNAVVGIAGWQSEHYSVGVHQMGCKIGVHFPGVGWVFKTDGAWVGNVDVDIAKAQNASKAEDEVEKNAKGAFSDAFKRAAFSWGIGEYLYELESPWIDLEVRGRSKVIPRAAMPRLNAIADAALKKWQAARAARAKAAAAAAAATPTPPATGSQPSAPTTAAAPSEPSGGARPAAAKPEPAAPAQPDVPKAALPFIEAMRTAPDVVRLFEIKHPFRQGQPGFAECEHECAAAVTRLMRAAPTKKALNAIATASKDRFPKDSPEYQAVERGYGTESDRIKKEAAARPS